MNKAEGEDHRLRMLTDSEKAQQTQTYRETATGNVGARHARAELERAQEVTRTHEVVGVLAAAPPVVGRKAWLWRKTHAVFQITCLGLRKWVPPSPPLLDGRFATENGGGKGGAEAWSSAERGTSKLCGSCCAVGAEAIASAEST